MAQNQAGRDGNSHQTTSSRSVRVSRPAARPRTILFITDQLTGGGGSERILLKTVAALQERGFVCHLVTFLYDPGVSILRNPPCPLTVLPLRRTYDLSAVRVARSLRQLVSSLGIEIVHTFHETSDLWGGMIAKFGNRVSLVSSRRDMGCFRQPKHDIAYRMLHPFFDRVLTVSEEVRKYCIQRDGLRPERVITLYNGVDLDKIDSTEASLEFRRSLEVPDHCRLVTAVGNIRSLKGYDILVRAAATVCRAAPDTRFLIVGDVIERDHFAELQRLRESLNLNDSVRFLGHREDINRILKVSDVFCLPSRTEGFSNALIEAMGCGLACVATDVGGNGEAITDGVNGFLVRAEDPSGLASRLLELVRGHETARRMGAAAREAVATRFSFDRMIANLVQVYNELGAVSR